MTNTYPFTKAQLNVLGDILTMPAKFRHHRRPAKDGGWIAWRFTYHFQPHVLDSLLALRLIETSQYGIRATSKGDQQ